MDMMMKKQLFRPDEVAQILCLSRRTVYRMIRDGRLPAVRLGAGPWRIYRETLLTLLPSPLGDLRRPTRDLQHQMAASLARRRLTLTVVINQPSHLSLRPFPPFRDGGRVRGLLRLPVVNRRDW